MTTENQITNVTDLPPSLSLNPDILRAAMRCINPHDIRERLTGVHLTPEGRVTGTDGHTLYQATDRLVAAANLSGELLLQIDKAPPARTATARLVKREDKTLQIDYYDAKGAFKASSPGNLLPYQYPDTQRVIPTTPGPTEIIGLDPAYLARAKQVFPNARALAMTLHGKHSGVIFRDSTPTPENAIYLVMPVVL